MKLRLPGRVPLRLRVFFRGAFALLALATLALALGVLRDEKQRSHRSHAEGLKKTQAQITARLRHPTGQLALLNPQAQAAAGAALHPLVLPFSAIDFDDRGKARQAVEMAGCALRYADGSTLCLAVGANPYAGGFVYAVGSFASATLVPHRPGELDLSTAHRLLVSVRYRGRTQSWIAPYELAANGRGRLTGFAGDAPITPRSRPVRDFRGWLWQEGQCAPSAAAPEACRRSTMVSVRLPLELLREILQAQPLVWPPADLDRMAVRLQMLAPGDGTPIFDSAQGDASLPFALTDLRDLLAPGERLTIRREGQARDLFTLAGGRGTDEPVAPWLEALIRRLPIEEVAVPAAGDNAAEIVSTALARYEVRLDGDLRSVNQRLAAVATRLSWFVGAMLLAVLLTWLAIEIRIIRRVTLLTRRAAAVSSGVRATGDLGHLDLSDLRGGDELGVLAQGLEDLLNRVHQDARREQIRATQEREQWHAVGHEIMSPLQSLMALHGDPADPSARYITRMQNAVRVLYGQASPSEAFETTHLSLTELDLDAFFGQLAGNAAYIGIDAVVYQGPGRPLRALADEYRLEDVATHVLRNADRHRRPGSPIRIELRVNGREAQVRLHNEGPPIDPAQLDRIFEYGISTDTSGGQRGQGLFVARTYMAKMHGTIAAQNSADGVVFTLTLPLAP